MFKIFKFLANSLTLKHYRRFSNNQYPFLAELGLKDLNQGAYYDGQWQTTASSYQLPSINPNNHQLIANTQAASLQDYEKAISKMQPAQKEWASIPMPIRGDIVRQIGEAFRGKKEALGKLVSL